MSSRVGSSSQASSVPSSNQSETAIAKLVVTFDLKGNPVGENKNKMNGRALALAKVIFGVAYDNWKEIPDAKKDDLWETLLQRFEIPAYHKDSVLGQVSDQWKTWKKNIRKNYLGKSSNEILMMRDKVPTKEGISMATWNKFIEREATPQKLAQRVQNSANRAKKKDVHMLGAKSYSQVAEEWQERTAGTEDEGLEPNRVNLYLYARKDRKTGKFHPNIANDAAKVSEMRSIQDESSQNDIDSDALTRVLGKDKRGRTRGVGSKVSRTKLKATRPIISELQQVKNDMHQQKNVIERQTSIIEKQSERLDNMESTFSSKMDFMISLMQSQSQKQFQFPSFGPSQINHTQVPSSLPNPTQIGPIPAHKGYYHIKDIENKKNIAMGQIEDVTPGTIVHTRAMVALEAKVSVLGVYSKMENEKVYLGQQGCADTIGEFVGLSIVWPLNLLEKII